jgi:dynein heavy chain
LLEVVFSTLKNVSLAMKGLIVLSNELDEMATQMYNNITPALWKKRSYPSLKPLGAYADDFVEKMKFFNTWIDKGQPNVFWITGIFFTHALLTGTLQNYARKKNMPIDLVVFDFEIMPTDDDKEFDSQPEDGMFVKGCFIEGAIWNYEMMELDESKPKVLYGVCPIMWFKPSHKDYLTKYDHYNCPMYRTDDRRGTLATTGHSTNFVMAVRLPSSKPMSHWIKRGTALLTTLKE